MKRRTDALANNSKLKAFEAASVIDQYLEADKLHVQWSMSS